MSSSSLPDASINADRFDRALTTACVVICLEISLLAFTGCTPSQVVVDAKGREVDPLESCGEKATVFLFVRTDCPISNRYAPLVGRFCEKYESQGVRFILVYSDPGETVNAIRQHVREYSYPCDFVRDVRHDLVRMTGALRTPEAAVYRTEATGPRLVYCGRIDDQHVDYGKQRAAPTKQDLLEVLDAILEDRPVTFSRTAAVGCMIPDRD